VNNLPRSCYLTVETRLKSLHITIMASQKWKGYIFYVCVRDSRVKLEIRDREDRQDQTDVTALRLASRRSSSACIVYSSEVDITWVGLIRYIEDVYTALKSWQQSLNSI